MSNLASFYIVDDHPMMRDGLRMSLKQFFPELTSAGESSDANTALTEILACKPGLVIIDHKLRGPSGLDLLKSLRPRLNGLKFLLVTQIEQAEILNQYADLGIQGILLKENTSAELQQAVNDIAANRSYRCSSTRKILENERAGNLLTRREVEVIRLMTEGKSNKEIAQVLGCSDQTVKTHKANLMRKLELSNTVEVSMWALKKGLV